MSVRWLLVPAVAGGLAACGQAGSTAPGSTPDAATATCALTGAAAAAPVAGGLTALAGKYGFGPDQAQNGGFEVAGLDGVAAGWSATAGWARDTSQGHAGAASLRLTDPASLKGSQNVRQSVFLKKGTYRLSGWIKTESLATNSKNGGARLSLNITPPGGPRASPSTEVARGTLDWTYFEEADIVVPDDRQATVMLEGYMEPNGIAWFDDVKVEEQVPAPLDVFLLYPNYRGMLFEDQPGTIRLDVTVNPPEGDFARYKVVTTLAEEGSGKVVAKKEYGATGHLVAELDGCAMTSGSPYLAKVALVSSPREAIAYEYPPYRVSRVPAAARATMNVAFDHKNRILVHGQPRFVLGVYDSGLGFSDNEGAWERQLWAPDGDRRLSGLPINFYLNYWYGRAPAEAMRTLMESLHRHDVMYLQTGNCHSDNAASGKEFSIDTSDAYLQAVGTHPASGGYYTIDECDSALVPAAFAQYQRIKALDRDGVTLGVQQQWRTLFLWRDAADVLATDNYPLYGAEPPEGYPHSQVAEGTVRLREAVKDARPFMTVLQFFKSTAKSRFPTREEMRNHAYMAIVEGARGLFWWSLGANALAYVCRSGSAYWCDERMQHMEDLKAVVSEIASLEPALLADDSPSALVGISSPSIRTRVKRSSGGTYLFAYNHENAAETARFEWGSTPARISVVGENRAIAPSGRAFSDPFGPYQAHVYLIE